MEQNTAERIADALEKIASSLVSIDRNTEWLQRLANLPKP